MSEVSSDFRFLIDLFIGIRIPEFNILKLSLWAHDISKADILQKLTEDLPCQHIRQCTFDFFMTEGSFIASCMI